MEMADLIIFANAPENNKIQYYVSCIQMFVSHAMCVASVLWSGQYIYRAEGIDSRGSINFGNRVYTIIIG